MPLVNTGQGLHQGPVSAVCEFCSDIFYPRPQTKKPRACSRDCCQRKRQTQNQETWRARERPYFPPSYHRQKRLERKRKCREIAETIVDLIEVGARLRDRKIEPAKILESLQTFLNFLGWRVAKKLWSGLLHWNHEGISSPKPEDFAKQFMAFD